MPFTSTICWPRMCVNTWLRMGTDKRNFPLRLSKVLKPSSSKRRSIRSSTSDCGMPRCLKFCGGAGEKPLRTGAKVAGMDTRYDLKRSIVRLGPRVYTPTPSTSRTPASSTLLVNLRPAPILFLAASLAFGGGKPASALFHEGEKAELAGQAGRADQHYF